MKFLTQYSVVRNLKMLVSGTTEYKSGYVHFLEKQNIPRKCANSKHIYYKSLCCHILCIQTMHLFLKALEKIIDCY